MLSQKPTGKTKTMPKLSGKKSQKPEKGSQTEAPFSTKL